MILFHQGCLCEIIACLKALTQSSHVNCQDNSIILRFTELKILCLVSTVLLMKIFPFSPRESFVGSWAVTVSSRLANMQWVPVKWVISSFLKWTASQRHCVLAVMPLSSSVSHMCKVLHKGKDLEFSKIVSVLCFNFTSQKIQRCKTAGGCRARPSHGSGWWYYTGTILMLMQPIN